MVADKTVARRRISSGESELQSDEWPDQGKYRVVKGRTRNKEGEYGRSARAGKPLRAYTTTTFSLAPFEFAEFHI